MLAIILRNVDPLNDLMHPSVGSKPEPGAKLAVSSRHADWLLVADKDISTNFDRSVENEIPDELRK